MIMNESVLMLSVTDIATLSPLAQEELVNLFFRRAGGRPAALPVDDAELAEVNPGDEDGPADLTVALCRKLIAAPIHEKSLAALRVIAESPTPEFHLADAVKAAPGAEEPNDLRGVWSGLTRRTRNILGDDSADLVWWEGEAILDEDDNYVDFVGRVSALTHQSLKTAMGIRS
jgi:hypothetical protein